MPNSNPYPAAPRVITRELLEESGYDITADGCRQAIGKIIPEGSELLVAGEQIPAGASFYSGPRARFELSNRAGYSAYNTRPIFTRPSLPATITPGEAMAKSTTKQNLETRMEKPSIGETLIGGVTSAAKKAIPAVIAHKAVAAGTEFAAKQIEEKYPGASLFIRSPAGQAMLQVVVPLLAQAACTHLPDSPAVSKIQEITQAGLDIGAFNAMYKVTDELILPMAGVMLQAAGIGGLLGAGGEKKEE